MEESKKQLLNDVHSLARLGVHSENYPHGGFVVHHNFESSSLGVVKSKQHLDGLLIDFKESFHDKFNDSFSRGDGVLRYQVRLCMSNVDDLRKRILEEAHGS